MRYFHRTSLSPDEVLKQADEYFASYGVVNESGDRHRVFQGTIGRVKVRVFAEGGHYTLINVETDQVGESEADKVAKRFLTRVHMSAEPSHVARGAY
jgi:hypothetical protein